ncbi:MAG: hypothetical protein U0791_20820 [Gemmataceae bacterium]
MNESPLPFHKWLDRLLRNGEAVFPTRPAFESHAPQAIAILRFAFQTRVLEIAGPPIEFHPNAAVQAARTVAAASWRLVSGEADPELELRSEPRSAGEHLSADVPLRFLPAVYRRARSRSRDDPLTKSLDAVLRAWPLSGVLADLDGEPTHPPDGGGHPGLQLLYAERFATTRRPGWLPPAGRSREWVERVFAERGLSLPAPPTAPPRGESCPMDPPLDSDDTPSTR